MTVEIGPAGRWICQTCGFQLTTAILRASDGAVGVNRRPVEDICPNDGTSLRPITWEEDAADANRMALEQMKRADDLQAALTARTQAIRAWAIYCFQRYGHDAHLYNGLADLAGMHPDAAEAREHGQAARTQALDHLQAALQAIRAGHPSGDCACSHDDEHCCARVGEWCAVCLAAVALEKCGADAARVSRQD